MPPETETPPAAPSPGLIARLAAAISNSTPAPEPDAALNALQSSFDALQAEHSALTDAATQAASRLEAVQAELTEVQGNLNQTCGVLAAIDSVIPGIAAAADPAAALTETITRRTADQVAAMGLPPGEAPGNDPKPNAQAEKTMSHDDFRKLPPAEANAFMRDGGKLTE